MRPLVPCSDPTSFANTNETRCLSLHLVLDVDFDKKANWPTTQQVERAFPCAFLTRSPVWQVLAGTASLTMKNVGDGVATVVLDTSGGLTVEPGSATVNGSASSFEMRPNHAV